MATDRFDLAESAELRYWLAREGDVLLLCTGSGDAPEPEVIGTLQQNRSRDLLLWAGGEGRVVAVLEGPMAADVKKAANELGLSEQMFVWNAVKVFLEVGASDR